MGCGSSSPANALAPGGEYPAKAKHGKDPKLAKADVEINTGSVDAVAGFVTVSGAATLAAGASSSDARGGLGGAAGAVGSALLGFAKQLPWVAPIAFVVAGVAQAAADVHALKRDAGIFLANVKSAEQIMVQVARSGKLNSVQDSCEALQFEMEEGLAFCHKLKTKYFVSQMLTSGRDCQKFAELSASIARSLAVISAAASIQVHDIITDEFEQGLALKDKIADLGGPAAIAADPALKAECQEFMSASDALIISAVDEVQRAVKLEAKKSQKKMDEILEQSRASTKVLEDQVANLTKMMEVLLAQRVAGVGGDASTDDGRKIGEVLVDGGGEKEKDMSEVEKKVAENIDGAMSSTTVRDLMSRMPVCDTEAERVEVVSKYQLNTEQVTDLIGDAGMRQLTDLAVETFGAENSYIGTIDANRQTCVSFTSNTEGKENQHQMDAAWFPNIVSQCKHVVKKDDIIQSNGCFATEMEQMPNLTFDDYAALAAAGHEECGRWLPGLGAVMADTEGAIPDDTLVPIENNPHGDKGMTYGAVRSFLAVMGSDSDGHYSGAPIKIEGQTVATFCVMDSKKRTDIDAGKMKEFAAKAGELFVERAKKRGVGVAA